MSLNLVYSFSVIRLFFFFKQKTAYEMRISDWSSDVCSSDLVIPLFIIPEGRLRVQRQPVHTLDKLDRHILDLLQNDGRMSMTEQIGRASCRERVCQYV